MRQNGDHGDERPEEVARPNHGQTALKDGVEPLDVREPRRGRLTEADVELLRAAGLIELAELAEELV